MLLEKKNNFIKLCTKFHVKEAKVYEFPAAQQTSTAKLPAFFRKILKTVRALRVNETKFTSRNAFIFNVFALEKEKESKKDERTLFSGSPRNFNLSLKP